MLQRLVSCVLSLVLGAVVVSAAQAAPATLAAGRPLVELRISETIHGHSTQYLEQDLLVLADGTAVGHAITADILTGLGWGAADTTGTAAKAQMRALQQALATAHIGVQTGNCWLASRIVGTGTAELSWYGAGVRRNVVSVTIGATEGQEECSAELQSAFAAVALLGAQALGSGGVF